MKAPAKVLQSQRPSNGPEDVRYKSTPTRIFIVPICTVGTPFTPLLCLLRSFRINRIHTRYRFLLSILNTFTHTIFISLLINLESSLLQLSLHLNPDMIKTNNENILQSK